MRLPKRGFSTVEILIVLVIIGILTTLGVVAYGRYRADANDSRKDAQLTTIADALEQYFQANGEYPSCASMTQSPSIIATSVLVGVDTSLFKAPGSTLDNSFVCTTPTSTDTYGYIGTGSSCSTVACNSYSLQYKTDSDGSVASVTASSQAVGEAGTIFTPLYSWDFTTQGNTGWTTGIYNSCSGGATVAWATTYYNMWSGDDGSRACYSSSSVNKSVSITSSEKLVVYIDAEISSTAFNGLAIGNSGPGLSAETRYYPNMTRKAIRLGVSANTVSSTTVGIEAISFWANSGTIKTQGRIYFYGIYVAKQSEEAQLVTFLNNKGLTVY